MLHYKQFTMLYSFISHKAKEVEEMLLAESKNLTVRDFETVVSEFGFFSCAVAMDPLKSEALKRERALPLLGLCNGVFIA